MLVHLSSYDESNYGHIKFISSLVSQTDKPIMYRINSLSTTAVFSYTTNEDYMKVITDEDIELTYTFHECRLIDNMDLVNDLNTLLSGALVGESLPLTLSVAYNDNGLLCFEGDRDFRIIDASHRVRLLFGLYNSSFPLISTDNVIEVQSAPICGLDNILYLTSKYDNVCITNADKGKEEILSIAYKVNELIVQGFPINSKLPGLWNFVNSSQMNHLEFELVDFQFNPVVLHSPLHITLEIQQLQTSLNDNIKNITQ